MHVLQADDPRSVGPPASIRRFFIPLTFPFALSDSLSYFDDKLYWDAELAAAILSSSRFMATSHERGKLSLSSGSSPECVLRMEARGKLKLFERSRDARSSIASFDAR